LFPVSDAVCLARAALPESAFKAKGNQTAMLSILGDAEAALGAGKSDDALALLGNLRRHVNGCPPAADRDDWIIDCPAQISIREILDAVIASIAG